MSSQVPLEPRVPQPNITYFMFWPLKFGFIQPNITYFMFWPPELRNFESLLPMTN